MQHERRRSKAVKRGGRLRKPVSQWRSLLRVKPQSRKAAPQANRMENASTRVPASEPQHRRDRYRDSAGTETELKRWCIRCRKHIVRHSWSPHVLAVHRDEFREYLGQLNDKYIN
jgi:hypothetical protein